jgi:hypothetical protein
MNYELTKDELRINYERTMTLCQKMTYITTHIVVFVVIVHILLHEYVVKSYS